MLTKNIYAYIFNSLMHQAESYRNALVENSSTSDKSLATTAESLNHHKEVRKFCERISEADAREYIEDRLVEQNLSCIYEMHRVADDDNNDNIDSATIRRKIGKIHSTVNSVSKYFRFSSASRRNPFKYDEEDKSPPPTAINGNILCFIERDGTLFDKAKYPSLSNHLVEFIEVFTTAALYPTINICPSIDKLGDSPFQRDDPKFFARVQRIVHLIGMNKFQTVYHPKTQKRDAEKHSKKEWEELVILSKWINANITTPSNKGDLYPNRAEYLEMIGFFRMLRENDQNNQKWMANFTDLKNHARVYGFKEWSKAKKKDGKLIGGYKLGIWTTKQRSELREGRFKSGSKHRWKCDLLNSIGFPWYL